MVCIHPGSYLETPEEGGGEGEFDHACILRVNVEQKDEMWHH